MISLKSFGPIVWRRWPKENIENSLGDSFSDCLLFVGF